MRPNCLCPVPSPIDQRGTDLKSVDTVVQMARLPILPSLPFTPFLLNNNQIIRSAAAVHSGGDPCLKNTDRAGEDSLKECALPSLLVFYSVLHPLWSCHLLRMVVGPVEETGCFSSVIGFGT